MICLNIEDIKPGMILTRPVRNHQGVLLLETGAKISKKNIRILKSWGVLEVYIKGRLPEAATQTEDSGTREKESIEKQLKEKFREVMDDPIMVAIFNAASNLLKKESL